MPRPAGSILRKAGAAGQQGKHRDEASLKTPQATHFGFLPVDPAHGSDMFFMYYEARELADELSTTPIVLWLQVSTLG